MNAAEILHTLTDQGFTLAVEGDLLTVNPSSRLTDAMRAEIRAHKPALVALLTQATNDTDPEVRRDILTGYGFDPDFQYPDSGRRTCRECTNLAADTGCRAARGGRIPNASRFYTHPDGIDALHRCIGYMPGPDDPDRRPGRERFDWLLKMMTERNEI